MISKAYPKYKPSGVEWLGDVPEHWGVKRLKYCLSLNTKKAVTDENPIALENIESWTGKFIESETEFQGDGITFKKGDVLFGKLRPYLAKVYLADKSGESIGDIFVLRPTPQVEPKYSAEILRTNNYITVIDGSTYGSKMPRASWEFIGNLLFLLPPLPEQQTIAALLDRETGRIDSLITKKQRLLELLKEKRTALISRAVTKGLDDSVKMKPAGVEWLGDVPEHWEVKRLKDLLQQKKGAIKTGPFGSQLLSSEMYDGDVKVYNQKSVITRNFDYGENYISNDKFEEVKEFQTFPGDFLITTRGTIGRCAILPQNAEKGILHPCLMRLQTDKEKVIDRFLEILIEDSGLILDQLRVKSNGTTIEVIYQDSLKNVIVILPPLPEQQAIAAFLDRETAKIDALTYKVETVIEKLKEYRTALISAAVTGKIDVRETV